MRLFLGLFCLFYLGYSFNFLVYSPLFAHSHSTFFGTICDFLTDAGHNVTFFTPTIVTKYRNISYTKSTKDVVHMDPSQKLKEFGDQLSSGDISRFWTEDSSASEIIPVIRVFQNMYNEQAEVMKNNLEILDDLKRRKFDVMIFEAYVFSAYPLMDYLDIKTFIPSLSVTHNVALSESIGEPAMPSVVSDGLLPHGEILSFWERIVNVLVVRSIDSILGYPVHRSFKPPFNVIDIRNIEPDASFVFINSNPFLDFPRPTLTKTVEIGGISVDVAKIKREKLPEEWSKILNLREKTILVSFGSLLLSKDMPLKNKKALVRAMREFEDVTFIWKYEDNDFEEFSGGVENIKFAEWVPQRTLLADPRLSAFLTHGGLGSINELSYLGKPAILCPLFADQMRNTKMLTRHNGSIGFSKYDLSNSQKIVEVFQKILYDNSYSDNSKKLAEQLENQPIKPKDLMVKHAESAARFGRLPSLDPYSRKMGLIEYFMIDVAFFSLTLLVCSAFVIRKSVGNFYVKIKIE